MVLWPFVKVKIFGFKNLTLNNVTKKNFEDVKLVAIAKPSEDSQQNKALKQKAKIDLYTLFKDDPRVPGQMAMRRSVAKTFDIDADDIEAWFTEEEKPEDIQIEQNPDGQSPPEAPPGANPPKVPTDATALKSLAGKDASRAKLSV